MDIGAIIVLAIVVVVTVILIAIYNRINELASRYVYNAL
jgi:hypothetical protein